MPAHTTRIGLYGLIMLLNGLVALMFVTVTTPVPMTDARVIRIPAVKHVKPVAAVSGTPNRLVVGSVGVDITVATGAYDAANDSWTIGDTSAYYADVSVPVNNNNGTTLIYGHARDGLFASLAGLQAGAEAEVYTTNGRVFHYTFQSVRNVDPTDTSIFTSSGPPVLTLQTCTGPWDAYRALYRFSFVAQEAA